MKLNKDVREEIELKYHDGTSEEILRHLRRSFKVSTRKTDFMETPIVMLEIGSWNFPVKRNKKYLKNRISKVIEEEFSNYDESVRMKTIKRFLDMVLALDLS